MRLTRINSVFKRICLFLALLPPAVGATSWELSTEPPNEVGVEVTVMSVLVTNALTGTLTARRCDECEPMRFRVTPSTNYYLPGRKAASLTQARALNGKLAVIVYDVGTNTATTIARISP